MDGLQAPVPGEEDGVEDIPGQPADGMDAGETEIPAEQAAPAPATESAVPAAPTISVDSNALSQLMIALANMTTSNTAQTSIVQQPRPFVPDFRKALNLTTWPS